MLDAHNILDSKILVVDDEPANVRLLDQILQREGYTSIRSTTDSREVVEIYQEFQPELVLLDLNMPHLGGIQVMKELKKIENNNHIPVMIITAQSDNLNCVMAFEAGALDFLSKPFDFLEVSLRIRNLLRLLFIIKSKNNEIQDLMETIREHDIGLNTERIS